MASGATCVQRLDGSRDSAIHTKYRISLRSSSMQEPRYPLPRVIVFSNDVLLPPHEHRLRVDGGSIRVVVPWRIQRRGLCFSQPRVPEPGHRAYGASVGGCVAN
ncbi:hypothetical protein SESBI_35521, partial [Sesbania bispinosa]